MARRRLIIALVAVVLMHAATLEWMAGQLQPGSILQRRADPMFTRLLTAQPAPPPPPAAAQAPAHRATKAPAPFAVAARRAASASKAAAPSAVTETVAAAAAEHAPAPAPSPEPEAGTAAPPSAAASAPSPAPAGLGLDSWPADTRLSYRLGGQFRGGELYGDARVQWQREAARYQVRVDVDVTLFAQFSMTSQGEVTPAALRPEAYEEARRGKRRSARFGSETVELEGGRTAPRPEGMQDTASQFVELSHRFATGRERLEAGRTVSLWLARPGGVDYWTYDIAEREMLKIPSLGSIEAWRLTPRPITKPRGNITAEMWFSPQLQYLPVRIKLKMGEEAFLDLVVDRIEQR